MADLLFGFNIERTAKIFDEDNSLKKILMEYGLYLPDINIDEPNPERIKIFENLASLFLANHDFISEREIDDLWTLHFLRDSINNIFNKQNIVDGVLYRQLIFSYKYSTIKHFFRDNFTKFLPSLDASVITDSNKMSLFQSAFMQEYDRFADIIDNIYNITDIDKVGNDYLSYLVQILGYEKGDDKLLGKDSFRELAKNIVEVYKIKGTNYSFELFFNFLGFDVELSEFYFDRRYADSGISINPYTGADNPQDFSYYLTPKRPTEYVPKNMDEPHQVMDNELTDIRSHLWWDKKIQEGYSTDVLLGLNKHQDPPEGFDFTFFKTNIIQYSVKRIRSKETDADTLSEEDEKIIQAYADFLTPIFISKQVLVSVKPFEDGAENLLLTDTSIYKAEYGIWENMFKAMSNWFIYDDWTDNPTGDLGDRAALTLLEETDVSDYETGGINKEEPREYYLFIKTHDHLAQDHFLTKDNMTNMSDGAPSSNEAYPSPNFFKINVITVPNTDLDGGEESGELVSLYDMAYTEGVLLLHQIWNMIPYDDPDTIEYGMMQGLAKILNFDETLFNRIHHLEELNVLNRDYTDWDDFSISRKIPTFEDAFEQEFDIQQFDYQDLPGNDDIYISNDDDITHTPWWFYDKLLMKKTTYNFIGFGFIHAETTVRGELVIERVGGYPPGYTEFEDPLITSGGLEIQDFLLDIEPVSFGKIKVSGIDVVAPQDFDNGNDFAFAKFEHYDISADSVDYEPIPIGKTQTNGFGYMETYDENGILIDTVGYTKFTTVTGNIYSSGSSDSYPVIERIGTESIGIFTGTYESLYELEREPTGVISTLLGGADYINSGSEFLPENDFAFADTTTPFIRGERSNYLYPDISDFALAEGSGSSLLNIDRTPETDFAQLLAQYQDIVASLKNITYLYSFSGEISTFYESDIFGQIVDPIFIIDSVPIILMSGEEGEIDIEYDLAVEVIPIRLLDGSLVVEFELFSKITDTTINLSGSAIIETVVNASASGDINTSGTAERFFIIEKDGSGSINILGNVEHNDFMVIVNASLQNVIGITYFYGTAERFFIIERDDSGSMIINGTANWTQNIEREVSGTVNTSGTTQSDDIVYRTTISEYSISTITENNIVENDYINNTANGIIDVFGSANEDERYLRYTTIVSSLGIFSDGNIESEVIYTNTTDTVITTTSGNGEELIDYVDITDTAIATTLGTYEIEVKFEQNALIEINSIITSGNSEQENIYEDITDTAIATTSGASEQENIYEDITDVAIATLSYTDITADSSDYTTEVGGLTIASNDVFADTIDYIEPVIGGTTTASGTSDQENIYEDTTDTVIATTSGTYERVLELESIIEVTSITLSNPDIVSEDLTVISTSGGFAIASTTVNADEVSYTNETSGTATASGSSDQENIYVDITDVALADTTTSDIVADEVV